MQLQQNKGEAKCHLKMSILCGFLSEKTQNGGHLFPVFPSQTGCSQGFLGTVLFNDDNGLGSYFRFVPSVPKIFGHIPRGSLCPRLSYLF